MNKKIKRKLKRKRKRKKRKQKRKRNRKTGKRNTKTGKNLLMGRPIRADGLLPSGDACAIRRQRAIYRNHLPLAANLRVAAYAFTAHVRLPA